MIYAATTDMTNRYPNRDLVQITNEDPTQATVNEAFLTQFLTDASAEIDGYLESRFALPLSDPPAMLTQLCCRIAMYHMQQLRPLHDLTFATEQYKLDLKFLAAVAKGELTLGQSLDNLEPPEAVPNVQTVSGGDPTGQLPQRVFTRGNMRGF